MYASMPIGRLSILFILIFIILIAVGCSTIEMVVELPPTPDQEALSTLSSLMFQVTRKADQIAKLSAQLTPTPGDTSARSTILPAPLGNPQDAVPYESLEGLVYLSENGELWILGSKGLPTRLTQQKFSNFALSPLKNDLQLIYTDETGDLWLVDLENAKQHNITKTPGRYECCPLFWRAKPGTLVFTSQQSDDPQPMAGYLTTVSLSGEGYRVLDEEKASIGAPAPSPDGETIAYDRNGESWLYDWEEGPQPLVAEDYGLQPSENLRAGSPAWSPDGKQLAWMVGGGFGPGGDWRAGVAIFDMERMTSRLVHLFNPLGRGGWFAAPVWSPDGNWLAFVADTSDLQSGLWVVGMEEMQDEEFYLGGSNPVWSPDSRWLAYTITNENVEKAWLLDVLTRESIPLAVESLQTPFAWIELTIERN